MRSLHAADMQRAWVDLLRNLKKQQGRAMRERTALREGGLDQERSVNDVEVGRRVLRKLDPRPEYFRRPEDIASRQGIGRERERRDKRNVRTRQNARLRRNHFLAAVLLM